MIDNFDLVGSLLEFDSEDDFYFVQILQRKKDNPGGVRGCNNSSRLIKAYYISSLGQLMDLKGEMVHMAEYFNARVGIGLNRRSYYKTAFHALQTIANQMSNKDFRNVKRAYNTACGVCSGSDRRWILDVDSKDKEHIDRMLLFVGKLCDLAEGKIVALVPTRSGYHVITTPFNPQTFKQEFPDVEIHKNNPTNLYIP